MLFAYDGAGNLTVLLDASNGSRVATYEYDPYGRLLRKEGSYAASNPFRFSTKYWDEETGLIYYGYRYYSPNLGRFINRDPIEESGGLNIYAFVTNNPINLWDYMGHGPTPHDTDAGPDGCVDFFGRPTSCDDSGDQQSHDDPSPPPDNKPNLPSPDDAKKQANETGEWVEDNNGTYVGPKIGANKGDSPPNESPSLPSAGSSSESGGGGGGSGSGGNNLPTAEPAKPTQHDIDECKSLRDSIIRLNDQFVQMSKGPSGPPPSVAPAIGNALKNDLMGTLSVASQLTGMLLPGGSSINLLNSMFGASADLTAASRPQNKLDAVVGAISGTASLSLTANEAAQFAGYGAILSTSAEAGARATGWAGVAIFGIKDFALPAWEANNAYYSQFHTNQQIQAQWNEYIAPQISALSEKFNAMGCGKILGYQ